MRFSVYNDLASWLLGTEQGSIPRRKGIDRYWCLLLLLGGSCPDRESVFPTCCEAVGMGRGEAITRYD